MTFSCTRPTPGNLRVNSIAVIKGNRTKGMRIHGNADGIVYLRRVPGAMYIAEYTELIRKL